MDSRSIKALLALVATSRVPVRSLSVTDAGSVAIEFYPRDGKEPAVEAAPVGARKSLDVGLPARRPSALASLGQPFPRDEKAA